jgi:hypothetical protein
MWRYRWIIIYQSFLYIFRIWYRDESMQVISLLGYRIRRWIMYGRHHRCIQNWNHRFFEIIFEVLRGSFYFFHGFMDCRWLLVHSSSIRIFFLVFFVCLFRLFCLLITIECLIGWDYIRVILKNVWWNLGYRCNYICLYREPFLDWYWLFLLFSPIMLVIVCFLIDRRPWWQGRAIFWFGIALRGIFMDLSF